MWWERVDCETAFRAWIPSQFLLPERTVALPSGLLPAPEDSPNAQLLPVAWHLLLPATTPCQPLTLDDGNGNRQLRQIFWYSSPPSLRTWLFLLNPNTENWMIWPPLSHSFLLPCLSLTEDITACSDSNPQYKTYLSENPMVRKNTKWYLFSISFAFPSWSSSNHMPLVLIIKPLYSYSPPANAMGPE